MPHPIVCQVTDRKSRPSTSPDPVTRLVERIRLCLDAGVDWIQIREKDLPGRELLVLAGQAVSAAQQHATARQAPRILINDRFDVALAARASGVHLGGESLAVADVVRWCRADHAPAEFQVGVSCHSLDAVRAAEESGANYTFFGPMFDTPSKRAFGPPQGLNRLEEVCRAGRIPVIAIGGVNETNARDCLRAGASGIAAIRLFQEKTQEAIRAFVEQIHNRPLGER